MTHHWSPDHARLVELHKQAATFRQARTIARPRVLIAPQISTIAAVFGFLFLGV
jgi:hypothetical protein